MSDDRPWEAYRAPAEATATDAEPWRGYASKPAVASAAPTVGYAEDIAKGTAGGLGRGVAGLVGLPGTIGSLTRWGAGKLGVSDEGIEYGKRVLRNVLPPARLIQAAPDAEQVQRAMESVTGKFYEPKTVPGQYASTIGEFAPGALVPGMGVAGGVVRNVAARTANTIIPAITSETAGQLTKDTPYEPYARFGGGVFGGVGTVKSITPTVAPSDAYRRAVGVLEKEGIPLTAGQRTGSKPVQYMESNAIDMPVVGAQAARLKSAPDEALSRVVTHRIYDPAELAMRGVPEGVHLPDPRVASAGPKSLSDAYTRLTQAPFVSNPQFQNRMTRAQAEYERLVNPHKRSANIENTQNDIVDRLVAGQGRMAGDEYQAIRSQIATDIRAPGINPREKAALTEYKRALDEAYLAGLSPASAAALMQNNRRYALMKQIQPAVDTAGETLSPVKLAQSVRSRRGAQYSAQQGDLDELARAAKTVMTPLPNSGTAARTGTQQMFMGGGGGIIGSTLGATVGGPVGAGIGAVAGAAVPFIPSYLATSRLGQAYLGNRVLPQNTRDVLAQVLAQQAISQQTGIERNQANRDAYKELQRVYINRRD